MIIGRARKHNCPLIATSEYPNRLKRATSTLLGVARLRPDDDSCSQGSWDSDAPESDAEEDVWGEASSDVEDSEGEDGPGEPEY